MAHLCSGRCTCSASWHTEVAKLLFRKKEAGITAPFRMTLPNKRVARDRRPLADLHKLNGLVRAAARDGGRWAALTLCI